MADANSLWALLRESSSETGKSPTIVARPKGVEEAVIDAIQSAVEPDENLVVPATALADLAAQCGLDISRIHISLSAPCELRSPPFGAVLKSIREEKKITQAVLAERAGVGVGSVIQYEQGRRAPSLPIAAKLAKALGVDLGRFANCDFGSVRGDTDDETGTKVGRK